MYYMHPYKSLNHYTGVIAYQNGLNHIAVQFKDGTVYLYTNKSAGQDSINQMKKLAKAGVGLTTYINQHVKDRYEAKIK
jgi:macrodomain Ter protein organizer (MatP/YcbG family)